MRRKLVQQGNGALTITLPLSWVKSNSLRKGDYIDLTTLGREMLLSYEGSSQERVYTINLSTKQPFFKRYVRTCYIYGYDKLIINSTDIIPLKEINISLNTLIGFEIIEQSNFKVVISIIASDMQRDNLEQLLKRLFFMVSSLISDVRLAVINKNNQILQNSEFAENSINKLANFCLRTLNKYGFKDNLRTQNIYFMVSSLEEIADEIYMFSIKCKSFSTELGTFIGEIKSYLDEIYLLFFKFDSQLLQKVKEKRINLYSKISNINVIHPESSMQLYSVLSHLHQVESSLYPLFSDV